MPAKKTTKKAPAKKAAKKAAKSISEMSTTSKYDPLPVSGGLAMLREASASVGVRQNLVTKRLERRKGREIRMLSFSDSKVQTYASMSFYMDWLLNSRGLPQTVYNFIGRDGSGKSSFFFTLIGALARSGVSSAYFACEKKDIDPEWAMRCFSSSRAEAREIADLTPIMADLLTLDSFYEQVVEYLKEVRDIKSEAFLRLNIPVALYFDPLNKLPTAAQMAGVTTYDGGDKEKSVGLGDRGHMLDRSKWYHDLMQRLTCLLPQFNCRIFIGEHQNQGGAMGSGPKGNAFTPEYMKEGGNRTRPGGEAINQTAGIQLTLVDRGFIYSAGEKIARRISVSPLKSSHGPSRNVRYAQYALKQENFRDTEDFLDPCVRWDYTTLEWCATNGYFGASCTGKTIAQQRYNIEELHLRGLSLEEAAEELMAPANQPLFERLGHELGIPGYFSVKKVVEEGGGGAGLA